MAWSVKKAIVVGASSGIGEAMARRLAAQGAEVALVARRHDELERVAAAIRSTGGKAHVHVHDAAQSGEAAPLFDEIVARLGGLDCLVYAAGTMPELAEGECEVDTGRRIGADAVISGDVLKFGARFKLSLRLHETKGGRLIAAAVASGATLEELDADLQRRAAELLSSQR